MKVKLIRNWFDEVTRTLHPAGTELEVTAKGGPGEMPKEKYDLYAKIERDAPDAFIPYFAATDETKTWLKERDARQAKVKAENARRASAIKVAVQQ